MNLQLLASHTVDADLLPEAPIVLDVGCRGFDFANEILTLRPHAKVIALDPARDVRDAWKMARPDGRVRFWPFGLVGSGIKTRRFAHFSTGEGDFITDLYQWHDAEMYEIETVTLSSIMLGFEIRHFDAVKLDCEGSEFDILEHWPGPIATQISVEFHDWDKPNYRSENYYDRLWKILPWYRIVQHEFSKQGEGIGHWDTLLVLR